MPRCKLTWVMDASFSQLSSLYITIYSLRTFNKIITFGEIIKMNYKLGSYPQVHHKSDRQLGLDPSKDCVHDKGWGNISNSHYLASTTKA